MRLESSVYTLQLLEEAGIGGNFRFRFSLGHVPLPTAGSLLRKERPSSTILVSRPHGYSLIQAIVDMTL